MSIQIIRSRGAALILGLTFILSACSDAATRVAYDIEAGTKKLSSQDGSRIEIPHSPRSWPDGWTGSYTLRIEKGVSASDGQGNFRLTSDAGGLLMRCYSGGNLHGWGTTYHLRFVDVPETFEINKQGGETTIIEVERKGGRAVVVGLH